MSNRVQKLRDQFAGALVSITNQPEETGQPEWTRDSLSGRLTELSSAGPSAGLTAAVGLILEAQKNTEPVAWITYHSSSFYPPDVAESGVDLRALVVVRVPDATGAGRAAERLVRSGAFGLLILDLGAQAQMPIPIQGRLVGLAQHNDTAIVCLTEKSNEAQSVGSMVSLRAETVREKIGVDRFRCKVKVLKDKRRGPTWSHSEILRGPAGMR